ncbi:hypothetical protein AJ79_04668 [Helicocarpus griseus UAMH5409]|uniref:Uncharacterized protein n=1 Tax=Helicocarpus griseus UAMH5409 TaxID=1447875 RepID=A0A2B7XTF0_9EURO|nr:hypothetical protein AJ79_04668 [Helicocarpus griseus UAMH5409]
MSLAAIFKTTLQSAILNASSNVIAQGISAYRHGSLFALDTAQVLRFMICTLVTTPFMVLWQDYLEATFPGSYNVAKGPSAGEDKNTPTPASRKTAGDGGQKGHFESKEAGNTTQKLNIRNTVIKILVDQTIGASWGSALFIVTISALQGQDAAAIKQSLAKDFFSIMIAGLKLWPMVSVISFTMVPPEKRVLTGSLFGMLWGIYLSLKTEG